VDVWLTPTSPVVAPALGRYGGLPPAQAFHEVAPVGAFTAIFNATGQPAASVPMGLTRAGMPMGVQLAGRPLGDEVVLRLARQLEQLMPWRGRVAPESA
jgi:amidase